MGGLKILMPHNFKPHDQKALDFVQKTFKGSGDVALTLFHVYTPVPEIETSTTQITGKLRDSMSYLRQKMMQLENELDRAREQLVREGWPSERVRTLFKPRKKDIAGEIIDQVNAENYNVIVVNRKPGRATRFFSASVHHKIVTALKDVTVCIVS
jgi:hypothetical protein